MALGTARPGAEIEEIAAARPLATTDVAHGEPDLGAITQASEGFTPADIRHAAQQVAQQTFERAVETGMRQQASTGDYLAMIAGTKPTLTEAMITGFAEDTASYPRT